MVQPGAMYNVYLSNGLLHPISKAENEVMQHKGAYILIRTVKWMFSGYTSSEFEVSKLSRVLNVLWKKVDQILLHQNLHTLQLWRVAELQ